ncbi:acyltransferase family protein [Legionella sp.]|uniref:acyltransferase family protein n=1 Tax=Legionella sp. TaxID=459 RepID=UPI003CAF7980
MVQSENKFSRLLVLDVFRGITITLMILVNSPGNRTSFAILGHSVWNGCTLADLVFPFFIFIVGVSSVLTLAKQRAQGFSVSFLLIKIIKRTIFLFSLGLLLNAASLHNEWSTLRFLGVLQRIAICYFFTSLLYLTTRFQTQAIILSILLIGYWLAMTLLPVPGYGSHQFTMDGNLAAYIDRLLISPRHLYTNTFDPEGLLSTLPAIATALLGNLLGAWLLSSNSSLKKLTGMIFIGVAAAITGWFWGSIFPINKALWTSSYVLWTGGLAILTFALCYWFIEIKHWQKWSRPFEIFGVSALAAYVLHVMFLKIQAMILIPTSDDTMVNLRLFITQTLFPISELKVASLLYALSYTFFWFLIITLIYQKKMELKRSC